jgi:rare lipoprotein A
LQVTDLRNGRKVVVLVNDYGPTAATGRVIDLSRGSYSQLEGLGSGTMPVEIRVVAHP